MPKLDKDEALRESRLLLDKIAGRKMTIFKKEISNLPIGALNQLVEFLRDLKLDLGMQ